MSYGEPETMFSTVSGRGSGNMSTLDPATGWRLSSGSISVTVDTLCHCLNAACPAAPLDTMVKYDNDERREEWCD